MKVRLLFGTSLYHSLTEPLEKAKLTYLNQMVLRGLETWFNPVVLRVSFTATAPILVRANKRK